MSLKHFYITVFVFIAILVVLNPSLEEHRFKVKNKVLDLNYNSKTVISDLSELNVLDNLISRDNYLIFSITKISLGNKNRNIGFGLLGNVYLFESIFDRNNLNKNNSSIKKNSIDQVKTIYYDECVKCHGDNGKLGAMNAADLTATKLTTDEISQVIKNGKGVMPGFTQYSDAEVTAISEYVLTLK